MVADLASAGRLLNLGVPRELHAADQGDVPRPLFERRDPLMDGRQPAAAVDEALERLLLFLVEYFARTVEEHDRAVAGQVFRRKRGGVFRGVDGEAAVGRELADGRDARAIESWR